MTVCSSIRYNGKCSIDNRSYYFSRASVSDAEEISRIYEQTRIDKTNYRTRLSKDSPDRFEKKGGMFVVMNEQEIAEAISDENSFWALFRDDNGKIAGSFWFSEHNEYYSGLSYEHIDNCIYPREVVVASGYGGKCIAQVMYHTCAEVFLKAGYTTGAADLYRVVSCEADGIVYHTDQVNTPSRMAVEAIGAVFAEPLPLRVLHLDGITVTIEPQMYIFDYARVAEVCKNVFRKKDIIITWG